MIIKTKVTGVTRSGDTLTVELRGMNKGAAFWRPEGRHEIQVPATEKNGRTYHVGRRVNLKVST